MGKEEQQDRIEQLVETIAVTLADFQSEVRTKFDGVETRLDGLETRFDGVETKVDGIETRFDGLETKVDRIVNVTAAISRDVTSLKGDVAKLEERTFSPEEKQKILDLTKHYDTVLEQDIHGKDHITLKRHEYDATSQAIGFPNRFDQPDEVRVD